MQGMLYREPEEPCSPQDISGVMRKHAYGRFSEGRAAHWLLLVAADGVDAVESHLRSFAGVAYTSVKRLVRVGGATGD